MAQKLSREGTVAYEQLLELQKLNKSELYKLAKEFAIGYVLTPVTKSWVIDWTNLPYNFLGFGKRYFGKFNISFSHMHRTTTNNDNGVYGVLLDESARVALIGTYNRSDGSSRGNSAHSEYLGFADAMIVHTMPNHNNSVVSMVVSFVGYELSEAPTEPSYPWGSQQLGVLLDKTYLTQDDFDFNVPDSESYVFQGGQMKVVGKFKQDDEQFRTNDFVSLKGLKTSDSKTFFEIQFLVQVSNPDAMAAYAEYLFGNFGISLQQLGYGNGYFTHISNQLGTNPNGTLRFSQNLEVPSDSSIGTYLVDKQCTLRIWLQNNKIKTALLVPEDNFVLEREFDYIPSIYTYRIGRYNTGHTFAPYLQHIVSKVYLKSDMLKNPEMTFFGDSKTAKVSYSTRYGQLLGQSTGKTFEIYAGGGNTTVDCLDGLPYLFDRGFRTRYAFLFIGRNDLNFGVGGWEARYASIVTSIKSIVGLEKLVHILPLNEPDFDQDLLRNFIISNYSDDVIFDPNIGFDPVTMLLDAVHQNQTGDDLIASRLLSLVNSF